MRGALILRASLIGMLLRRFHAARRMLMPAFIFAADAEAIIAAAIIAMMLLLMSADVFAFDYFSPCRLPPLMMLFIAIHFLCLCYAVYL